MKAVDFRRLDRIASSGEKHAPLVFQDRESILFVSPANHSASFVRSLFDNADENSWLNAEGLIYKVFDPAVQFERITASMLDERVTFHCKPFMIAEHGRFITVSSDDLKEIVKESPIMAIRRLYEEFFIKCSLDGIAGVFSIEDFYKLRVKCTEHEQKQSTGLLLDLKAAAAGRLETVETKEEAVNIDMRRRGFVPVIEFLTSIECADQNGAKYILNKNTKPLSDVEIKTLYLKSKEKFDKDLMER